MEKVLGIGGLFFRGRTHLLELRRETVASSGRPHRVRPVSRHDRVPPNGRFARLHDPEGNPIELWEPKKD
jgi:hypothetical protein